MSVHIRLARAGAKKRPHYRVVVTHHRSARDGRFLETIGTYDPVRDPSKFVLDHARFDYWTKNGATASDTVARLVRKAVREAAAAAAVPAKAAT
jgi:small subunit ribosomal protein S16